MEDKIFLSTVKSIIAQSSVNLHFMTAFHPSSKQQVDMQTLRILKPPNPCCLLKAAAPPGQVTLNLFF